jgi:outer membrane receptor protein involved in Fe transport
MQLTNTKGMLHNFSLIPLILTLLVTSTSCLAQSTVSGAVSGTVLDPEGKAVPIATIVLTRVDTNTGVTVTSGSDGRYFASNLVPGAYTMDVTAEGLAFRRELFVEVGRVTSIDTSLVLATQTQTITVTATADAPVLTTDRADISTNINEASIANLPISSRRWSNLVLLTPGAVPDGNFGLISFRGISGLLNNNTVDGGDNNQAFFGEEKGRTRLSYSTSQAFIQEYQVNTSNFGAEYGRSAGGVVNAVTKSGTNSFHGELFWYFRSSDFGATNPFTRITTLDASGTPVTSLIKPPDKRHQFGGAIGGPIVKDRLFFFIGGDQQKRNFPGVANAQSPQFFFDPLSSSEVSTLSGRGISTAQANTAFAFLQSVTGIVPRTGDQLILFPKLNWAINDSNMLTVSYNRLRWDSPAGIQTGAVIFRGRESFGSDFVKTDTVTTRLNSTITPTLLNEFRFTYGRDFEFQTSQGAIPGQPVSAQGVSPQITISGSAGIVFGKPNFLDRRRYPDERNYQFADSVSLLKGNHSLKVGFDINHINDLVDNLFQESGAYSYANRVNFISDYVAAVNNFAQPACGSLSCYASFNQGFGLTEVEFSTTDIGLFVQDNWRVGRQLTLNLGLRWDYQALPEPQFTNSLLPASSSFPSDKNNFGPRLGLAWDISGRNRAVLRGGYGMYYGRIITSTIYNAMVVTGLPTGQLQFTFTPTTGGAPRYPHVASAPPGASTTPPDVVAFAPDTQLPLIHQFDLGLEYEIARNMAFSIFYIGSAGRNLPRFVDTNLPVPTQTITYTVVGGPDNGTQYTMPLFTGTRPNSNFGRMTDISYSVDSTYNAMVLGFNRRMTGGLQVQTSYTYSRSTDFGQSSQTFTSSNNVLNPFDLDAEKGRSNFDIPHRFNASVIWKPAFFASRGMLARQLLDGWTIAPNLSISSGVPYTGGVAGNAPIAGILTGLNRSGGSGRLPQLERNSFRQPYTANVDLRIGKKFSFYETVGFEVFGDAFNLFNRVNVVSVGTTLYTAGGSAANPTVTFSNGFGVPSSSSSFVFNSRQIQIGAKLTF